MAARHALLRASPALTRSPRIIARCYSDSQYPFTKSSQPSEKKPTEQYPFTKAGSQAAPEQASTESHAVAMRDSGEVDAPAAHQPDYGVALDYRTSAFSPIPLRVMDGSEPSETVPAAVLSGAPTELQARTVRIYKPAKTATQSGDWHGHQWRMDWDILHKGHRWENPLMGWQSSADFMQGTHLNFKSKEDAIRFADKQGYEYFIQEPNERKFRVKQYATQFLHSAKPLKQIRTK